MTSQDVQPSTSGVARQLNPSKKRRERSPSPSSSDSSSIFDFEPLDEEEVVSEAESSTTEAFEVGDYVLARFSSKKHVFHYVGKLTSKTSDIEWQTKYFRRKSDYLCRK